MTEQTHPREHIWRVQTGNYPGNFEIMCICNSRCAYIPTLENAIRFTTMLNATERLSAEIRKTVSNLLVRGKISEGEHDCAMRRIADILEGKDE